VHFFTLERSDTELLPALRTSGMQRRSLQGHPVCIHETCVGWEIPTLYISPDVRNEQHFPLLYQTLWASNGRQASSKVWLASACVRLQSSHRHPGQKKGLVTLPILQHVPTATKPALNFLLRGPAFPASLLLPVPQIKTRPSTPSYVRVT
jgi:hypothetical protein